MIKKVYIIFLLILFVYLSCSNESESNFKCEWNHSQIVGHRSLSELNDKLPSFYIKIKCPETKKGVYVLRNKEGFQINLKKDYNTSEFLILSADIGSVDILLGRKIRDSINYKKVLSQQLENSILILDNKEEISKSNGYMTRFGYLERRIK